jgi:hypothetical protein
MVTDRQCTMTVPLRVLALPYTEHIFSIKTTERMISTDHIFRWSGASWYRSIHNSPRIDHTIDLPIPRTYKSHVRECT